MRLRESIELEAIRLLLERPADIADRLHPVLFREGLTRRAYEEATSGPLHDVIETTEPAVADLLTRLAVEQATADPTEVLVGLAMGRPPKPWRCCRASRRASDAPAPEAHDRAVPADPQRPPQPLEHCERLGMLSRRNIVRCGVAVAETELRRDSVDPGDVRVGDDLDRPVPRYELVEKIERPDADVDPGRGQHDAVRVARARIRSVLVDREPRAVERVERVLVDRERPPTLARPRPGGCGVDVEQHREGTPLQDRARRLGQHRAAPEGDHGGLGAFDHGCCDPLLDHPEPGLAVAREELLDRGAGLPLDLVIEVDEGAAEAAGDLLPEGRLARAHEPCEREVAVQGVRGHRMRSR